MHDFINSLSNVELLLVAWFVPVIGQMLAETVRWLILALYHMIKPLKPGINTQPQELESMRKYVSNRVNI